MCPSAYLIKAQRGALGAWLCVGTQPPHCSHGSLFPWQEDEVVLQCVANVHKEQRKFCLAAEGLGNRLCFLEPTSEAKVSLTVCPAPSRLAPQKSSRGWDCWDMVVRVIRMVRKKSERTHLFLKWEADQNSVFQCSAGHGGRLEVIVSLHAGGSFTTSRAPSLLLIPRNLSACSVLPAIVLLLQGLIGPWTCVSQ